MVRLQTAAEDGLSIRHRIVSEDLPWNLSGTNFIAAVSDTNRFDGWIPFFCELQKEMGFCSEARDVLQTGTETSVSQKRRENGFKIFQGGAAQALLS